MYYWQNLLCLFSLELKVTHASLTIDGFVTKNDLLDFIQFLTINSQNGKCQMTTEIMASFTNIIYLFLTRH